MARLEPQTITLESTQPLLALRIPPARALHPIHRQPLLVPLPGPLPASLPRPHLASPLGLLPPELLLEPLLVLPLRLQWILLPLHLPLLALQLR